MSFDIDSGIFIVFLIATIVIGLFSSRGTNTIKQYAIGNRNFSTATIVATIVATWVGGSFFYNNVSEVYATGLHAIWAFVVGDLLGLVLTGIIFIPRMGEFLGKLSIAEAMGTLFGERVRVITAMASFIGAAGVIAIQLKLAGLIFEHALDIPSSYGILIATFIVTLYSSLGGIKSVTFTDVIQFFTFGVAIPLSAYVLLTSIDNVDIITNTITTNHLFDYKKVFDFREPLALKYLFIFLFYAIPAFEPMYFQRITIARDTRQASRAFILAAITCSFLAIMVDWSAILILSIDPSLNANEAVKYMLLNSSYVGLKGVMLAGVMAMVMSTADSCINSTAVIIVHDFFKPLKMRFASNEIFSARIVSAIIGLAALVLSLYEGSLLELFLITASFYTAIVPAPFIMSVLGFRSSEKSVIISMVAGLTTVIIWNLILQIKVIDCVFVGMIVNLIFLVGSHYLLKQPGGWVGIKDRSALEFLQHQRAIKIHKFVSDIKKFNLLKIFKLNTSNNEVTYMYLGLFCIISIYITMYTIPKEIQILYPNLLNIIITSVLFSSTILISYPIWPIPLKRSNVVAILLNLMLFYTLVCATFLLVIISKFAQLQVMIFMINLIMVSILVRWQWAELDSSAKTEFLANISHELRTPLNAVIGFSEIILSETYGKLDNAQYKDYINDINNSGKHLLSVINDILDFSKASADKLQVENIDLDLNKLATSSMRFVKPRACGANVHLIEDLPQEHIVIKADPKRLKQALLNLLSNSVKFTPSDGSVTLAIKKDAVKKQVYIIVTDTGIGMSDKDIPKALSSFGQVDNKLSRQYEGTGLGLPLTKKLVELMSGIFDIQSAPGKGTVVTLTFQYSDIVAQDCNKAVVIPAKAGIHLGVY